MNSKFVLVAEPQMAGFTLHKEGEPWEHTFPTIRQAVSYVRSLPEHEGEVVVLNASGKEISHISVEEDSRESSVSFSPYKAREMRDPNRFLRLRARRSGDQQRPQRSRRRRRTAKLPWLRWVIIALLVAAGLILLMWRWPGGVTPMWIFVFPAALLARAVGGK